jgi:2-oxoisovalerate dehydrogenase E1 component
VTTDLARRAGSARVFNTLLDETTILGIALGASHLGLLPVPEIQYLAYYHNAEDQLRSEACSLQFFSAGQFKNPMVLRIASFGYQRGFGGHFHNDSSTAVLRDLPGIVIAAPSRPEDAVPMFRTCLAAAKVDGLVVVFLEPIALYMTKDLHEHKDGLWEGLYPGPDVHVPIGEGRIHRQESGDVTIITYANGVYLSLRAAKRLEEQNGIRCRVLDLRWLAPLDKDLILQHAQETGRVLIVDEGRKTGSVSETIATLLLENCKGERPPLVARVTAEDTYIPLGPAAQTVLPSEDSIQEAVMALMEQSVL